MLGIEWLRGKEGQDTEKEDARRNGRGKQREGELQEEWHLSQKDCSICHHDSDKPTAGPVLGRKMGWQKDSMFTIDMLKCDCWFFVLTWRMLTVSQLTVHKDNSEESCALISRNSAL